ncbi:hypothetical protein Pla175_30370 [Pirellulimonas nuda]|uniref:Uncharacterized protein n=1 Tax=Pirellulimonas nuda TaxID=2528009 RepID=A0A518DDT0_9BACT|nr:hypothetical protein [Pirellulimonas nuda]QDU89644.1 hypothetical protein Pla175_30370 [Pirellulimonas nuda]
MFADPQHRLIAFTRLLAVSVLCCLAFSWRLWVSRPHYPLVPLFEFVPALAFPFDYVLLGWLVVLLLGVVYQPRCRLLITLVLGTFGLLFVQDQSRLWPSFYQFSFLFLLLASNRRVDGAAGDQRVLASMRFVFAMVFFWGGVQKLNPYFFYEEFPWFVEPVTRLWPLATPVLPHIAVAAALFEMTIGVGLLTRRLRGAALGGAVLMNLLIFFCIGPLRDNWNNSSWMWGMTVAAQTWVLFFRAPPFSFRTMFAAPALHNVPQWLAVILIGFLPVLNNINRWDSALSFNVYSGNVDYAEIHMRPGVVDRLPDEIAALVHVRFGGAVLVPNEWSRRVFHANTYPETRVFKALFRAVCDYLPEGSAALYVREKAGWFFPKRIDRYELNGARGVELSDAGVSPPDA